MATLQPPPPAENITGTLSDLAPEDQVYRTTEGYIVKVKTLLDEQQSAQSTPVLKLSGSICGADGKALRLAGGAPAVFDLAQTAHLMAYAEGDPMAEIEDARLRCVAATVLAEKKRLAIEGQIAMAAGLSTLAERQARIAAAL